MNAYFSYLFHSAEIEKDLLARGVNCRLRLIQSPGSFREGQRLIHAPVGR
jgi:hypothetical protein